MSEPNEELGPRIRVGVGLVANMPPSAERRAAGGGRRSTVSPSVRRSVTAKPPSLQRQGRVPRTVNEVLADASFGMDRADADERRREREAAEILGRPEPRLNRWELTREVAAREAAKETTPATQADLSRLGQQLSKVKAAIHSLGGRPL